MNDRGKPIETRSEEVQEIMGAVPGWIVRQGIATLFLVVVALLAIAGLFRYPDVIPAEMTLTNSRPAARVVARVSGRIETLYVSDRQAVRAGDPLALIENAASAADVDRLSALLGAGFLDPDTALIRFTGVGELALGDIQSAFTDFVRALQDYRNYRELDYYPKKIAATRRQMARYGNYRASLERQVAAAEASHAIAGRQYRRDSLLYRQGIIAAEEQETARDAWLGSLNTLEGARAALGNIDIQVGTLEEALLDLELARDERDRESRQAYRNAWEALVNALGGWELAYRPRSPQAGRVTFTSYWTTNQQVSQGDPLFTVVPEEEGELLGVALLPLERSGKVRIGQRVIVRFDSYPDEEFGVVAGRVAALSLVPESDHYRVTIGFPEGLLTNYGRRLPVAYEARATAEIVTDDRRLIERLVAPLRRVLKEGLE